MSTAAGPSSFPGSAVAAAPWRMLVTIHSIFNVPKTAMAVKGRATFRVSCTCVGSEGKAQGSVVPEVTTSFEPSDIVVATDVTEVKLDGTSGSGRGSLEWTIAGGGNTCDIVVSIREESAGGVKTIATSQALTIDVKQLVEVRKLTTRVIGTTFGHVGVSFAVAPSDSAGYRRRLEAFLQKHNPQGLEHVSRVVSTMSELDTFTKTYRKYNIVNYEQRVRDFFEVYGPDHISEIDSIMKQWVNREEELMRNLVIDNGPELEDVDPRLRLGAFVRQYNVSGVEVEASIKNNPPGTAQWRAFMKDLAAKYGPEPDPRKYLFPATYFGEPPPSLRSQNSERRPATSMTGSALPALSASSFGPPSAAPSSQPPLAAAPSPSASVSSATAVGSAAPRAASALSTAPTQAPLAQLPPPLPPAPSGGATNVVELWSHLCEQLRLASVPNSELFYLNEEAFGALLAELRYDATSKSVLVAEWQRRVAASVRTEQLHSGDALFDSAKRDTYAVTGMHPLNVSIVSIVAIKNPEHESSYSLRLSECKMRATERLAIVGDYAKLLSIAASGVSPMPQAHRSAPACVFYRRPLHSVTRASAVCVLICDVAVGKPFVQPATLPQLTAPKEPSPQFCAEFDSCVFVDISGGQAIAAYHPQQVLPRFIVHCNVDPTVAPCPAHPSRPVEYYVVEASSFACSQCVVLGQHRGKEVLTLEDAGMQARNALLDLQRDAQAITAEMSSVEAELDQRVQNMASSEVRQAAMRAMEQVRRDAEVKIQAIQAELEQLERAQRDSISEARVAARRVYDDAQQVVAVLESGASKKGPVEAISLAVKLKGNGQVQSLRERAMRLQTSATNAAADDLKQTFSFGVPAANRSVSAGVFGSHSGIMQNSSLDQSYGAAQHSNVFATPSSAAPAAPQSRTTDPNGSADLFSKFVSLKQQQQPTPRSAQLPTASATATARATPTTTPLRVQHQALETEAKLTKEQMTRGWAEFRRGDRQAAAKTWSDVYERNAQNAMGARARAYIAEAIERDYDEAASWYERALSYDPKDTMTLYNYGVLLESVLGKKREALQLFDAAHQLGDHTAGRRAQQLRQQLA
jgi:tetratricopeptide (TPR) repeat protein